MRDPVKASAYQAAYREAHKDMRREYFAQHYIENKARIQERRKAYCAANRERLLRKSRADYAAKIEQRRAYARAYSKEHYAADPEKYHRKKKARWIANTDWCRAQARSYAASRKARKMNGAKDAYTSTDIALLMVNQRGRCWWCGKKLSEYHIDHRFPLAKGGDNTAANIVLCCPTCNLVKCAKMPMAFCGRLL